MFYRLGNASPIVDATAYIAPSAELIGNVKVGARSSIWFGTVARGDINEIIIGEETNIQDSCVLHITHEYKVQIGNRVTVGHSAILHGCTIGSHCLIAMGATILDGVHIEDNCLIAANTTVTPGTHIASGSLVMGTPGKVVHKLSEEDIARIEQGWLSYVEYAKYYKDNLFKLD